MGNDKERKEPPAYIDYAGDSGASAPVEYTSTQFYDYWKRALIRTHKMSTQPLTIKEKTLWKRLITTYEPEDLISMIDKWMDGWCGQVPASFIDFYYRAPVIHMSVQAKDYTWE